MERRLVDAGHDPEEVNELLYDPAPRRRGRRGKYTKVRSYDPAKKRKVTAKRTKKGVLAKLKPYVLPGTAVATFYSQYVTRAQELFDQGLITKNDVFEAINYDMTHFDANAAMTRVQENIGNIGLPLVGGFLIKETNLVGKHSGVVADVLYGLGIGLGAKTVLDPPLATPSKNIRNRPPAGNTTKKVVRVTQDGQITSQQEQQPAVQQGYNPYA